MLTEVHPRHAVVNHLIAQLTWGWVENSASGRVLGESVDGRSDSSGPIQEVKDIMSPVFAPLAYPVTCTSALASLAVMGKDPGPLLGIASTIIWLFHLVIQGLLQLKPQDDSP